MELWHYGVKGMKWGVRNYQNKDGTWTKLGKERRKAKWNLVDDSHAISTRHLEKKEFQNPGDVARTGEYWYNQHQEMLANMNVGHVHKRYSRYNPNVVVEYTENGKRQSNRILHDSGGVQVEQIHGGPHKWGGKKKSTYDKDGVHKHIFDQNGVQIDYPDGSHETRLTAKERKEQGDLLRRTPRSK